MIDRMIDRVKEGLMLKDMDLDDTIFADLSFRLKQP